MNLFAFAAALTIPLDQLVAVHVPIGDDAPNLVTFTAMGLNLAGVFGCFASG